MYIDKAGNIVGDNSSFTDSMGIKFPRNFPKDKIPELTKVTETEQPIGVDLVITGYTVNSENVQVWDTRSKTAEELKQEDDSHDALLEYEMDKADIKIIRHILANDTTRIEKHKTDQAALRAKLKKRKGK